MYHGGLVSVPLQIQTSRRRTIKLLSTKHPGTAITSWCRCCWRPEQMLEPWTSTDAPPFSTSSRWLASGPWPYLSSATSCCSTTTQHGSTHPSSTRSRHVVYYTAYSKLNVDRKVLCLLTSCLVFSAGAADMPWLPQSGRDPDQLLWTLKAHKEVESCNSWRQLQGRTVIWSVFSVSALFVKCAGFRGIRASVPLWVKKILPKN